mmetsp:Transcript_1557/g.6167  ORF Transcript_1557/g.6167 Transcript_1557/m.6167 type:complete len:201 (-) Transcript_1557:245-847(-)
MLGPLMKRHAIELDRVVHRVTVVDHGALVGHMHALRAVRNVLERAEGDVLGPLLPLCEVIVHLCEVVGGHGHDDLRAHHPQVGPFRRASKLAEPHLGRLLLRLELPFVLWHAEDLLALFVQAFLELGVIGRGHVIEEVGEVLRLSQRVARANYAHGRLEERTPLLDDRRAVRAEEAFGRQCGQRRRALDFEQLLEDLLKL